MGTLQHVVKYRQPAGKDQATGACVEGSELQVRLIAAHDHGVRRMPLEITLTGVGCDGCDQQPIERLIALGIKERRLCLECLSYLTKRGGSQKAVFRNRCQQPEARSPGRRPHFVSPLCGEPVQKHTVHSRPQRPAIFR